MQALTDVTARELMQGRVITLPSNATIAEAVATFEDEHISGAPVVDETGKPVGVLSSFDIAQTRHIRENRLNTERGEEDFSLRNDGYEWAGDPTWDESALSGKEDYSSETLGRETVGDWMTAKVISVPPEANLAEVCRTLSQESIHRVLVIEGGRVAGIISTSDIVRHLASAL